MITEDKVTELFCVADDFCKFFDAMMEKYTLKADKKRNITASQQGSSRPFGSIHQEGAARKMYWHKFRGQHSP